ncbi:MAG: hypothetical protein E8D45_03365 [Nitrospira sp.]|nr:MAG: hypothetical protein E8D45_03365 [Nitrospira sp.]
MNRIALLVTMVLLLGSPLAWAHGAGVHVIGTLAEITADHLDIRVPNGNTMTVGVNEKTRYRSKKATMPKPQVGDRVVIEAIKDGAVLVAVDVQFAPAPATPAK